MHNHLRVVILFFVFTTLAFVSFYYFSAYTNGDTFAIKLRKIVQGPPDFIIKDIEYKPSEFGGYIQARVCNNGGETRKNAPAYFWVITDKGQSTASVIHGKESRYPAYYCTNVSTISFHLLDPNMVTPGEYMITARVNIAPPDGYYRCSDCSEVSEIRSLIDEKNATNNTMVKTFFIDPRPLAVASVFHGLPENEADYSFLGTNFPRVKNEELEQKVYDMYVIPLIEEFDFIRNSGKDFIVSQIAYGVDESSAAIGMGERAAIWHSMLRAYGKPSAVGDWWSFAKIANGRKPFENAILETESREVFAKIYGRAPETDDLHDKYALEVMTYGLRQRPEDRSLGTEKETLDHYQMVFGKLPESTFEWNVLQAMTYAGVK